VTTTNSPVPHSASTRAADLNEHDAARGVEELVRHRLFQVVGEQLNFTHDRIRKLLDDGLLPPSRRVLHVAVAQVSMHATVDLKPAD
jgi:hypothetical protein